MRRQNTLQREWRRIGLPRRTSDFLEPAHLLSLGGIPWGASGRIRPSSGAGGVADQEGR